MKGTLIKRGEGDYKLFVNDTPLGQSKESPYKKLSLKNCEVIENGYDLDELAFQSSMSDVKEHSDMYRYLAMRFFKDGFQKALEILGDKRFDEEDILIAIEGGYHAGINYNVDEEEQDDKIIRLKDNLIVSLKQTEWDVEIEMICPHPMDTYVCGMQYGCDEDGCNNPNQIPYLDKNGCLILKKI